jgi:hypothetical protein
MTRFQESVQSTSILIPSLILGEWLIMLAELAIYGGAICIKTSKLLAWVAVKIAVPIHCSLDFLCAFVSWWQWMVLRVFIMVLDEPALPCVLLYKTIARNEKNFIHIEFRILILSRCPK